MNTIARTAHVSDDERRAMIGTAVTLNGRPAAIMGRLAMFAVIRTTDNADRPAYVGEWSWHAARHIIENGGAFRL